MGTIRFMTVIKILNVPMFNNMMTIICFVMGTIRFMMVIKILNVPMFNNMTSIVWFVMGTPLAL